MSVRHPLWEGIVPSWATAWGEDEHGAFVDFAVKDVAHRFRWVPAGTFVMGAPEGEGFAFHDETPHEVTLTEGYWMGETPVTQALWTAVVGDNPSHFKGEQRPVECVSWEDCQRFLAKLNEEFEGLDARLPTEAQWERACRAGTDTATWLGAVDAKVLEAIAWFADNSGGETHPVGEKQPNAYGLLDMLGNVWEWCSDWQAPYGATPVKDPVGASTGSERVLRGGSCFSGAWYVRAAYRGAGAPGNRVDVLGFRLSRGQGSALPQAQAGSAAEQRGATGRGTRHGASATTGDPASPRRA